MSVDERTYWARRAKDEVESARSATDPRAAERHRKLAELYLERSMLTADSDGVDPKAMN